MSEVRKAFGSWPSVIQADQIAQGALRLGQPRLSHQRLYWLEGRASEGGRQVLMSASLDGRETGTEVQAAPRNVRTLVHEYGGGDYAVSEDRVFCVDFEDQTIRVICLGQSAPLSHPGARYADLFVTPDQTWLLAVQEAPRSDAEPENRLVAFRIPPKGLPSEPCEPIVVAEGHDFYSSPVVSDQGDQLAFVAWDHPNMPWDGTLLCRQPWSSVGPSGPARVVAGGDEESVVQPSFSPEGVLTFISDRSGWWNLYQVREGGVHCLCHQPAEFAGPQWVFGLSSYGFLSESEILCAGGAGGRNRLSRLNLESGKMRALTLDYSRFDSVRVSGGFACFLGSSSSSPNEIVVLRTDVGRTQVVCKGSGLEAEGASFVEPQAIEFSSVGGRRTHAWFYRPDQKGLDGLAGERPPLLVKSHGGPTSAASPALDLRIQYWVSRGISVVDVDYGGSSGYGRAYRKRLEKQWGVVDVEDCAHAARYLAEAGLVDRDRLAISGGSAGGFTTLCALTFRDEFSAGASHYGIGDLEALVRDTHKFESRYMDRLVGPYPESQAVYRARSPIHFSERLSCPVIFFQGLEDRIVPPNQAEAMVDALAARKIRRAYVAFEGEQHGFRRAENIRAALEGELYFYSQIFGFKSDATAGPVKIQA